MRRQRDCFGEGNVGRYVSYEKADHGRCSTVPLWDCWTGGGGGGELFDGTEHHF